MTSMRYSPPGRGSNDAVMPHHAVVFSGSTRNCQTVSGLASIAIVRSTAVSVLLAMLALLSFSFAFQRLEALAPELVEEHLELDEPLRTCAVEAPGAVASLVHEPRLLQHGQMLGDRRPGYVDMRRDLARGQLPDRREPQDPAPVRGGDRLQRCLHGQYVSRFLR